MCIDETKYHFKTNQDKVSSQCHAGKNIVKVLIDLFFPCLRQALMFGLVVVKRVINPRPLLVLRNALMMWCPVFILKKFDILCQTTILSSLMCGVVLIDTYKIMG